MEKVYRHIEKALRNAGYASPIYHDLLSRLAKGTDASFYRLIPQLVVQVNSEKDVQMLLHICSEMQTPVTFKAGGTSLCGQTITDAVLAEIGPGFTKWRTTENGRFAIMQPGITGGLANARLQQFKRKIGPSPASIASAKIGGIIANNASGASYGIETNSYNTLRGLRIVLANGSILDSRNESERALFARENPRIISGLRDLSLRIQNNDALVQKIRHKYTLKNTTGYGLNALIDFDDPVDMLWHLMVGSEGTLGFISEATFETVDSFPCCAAALVFFNNIRDACKAILPLRQCPVSAAELMDRNALRAVQQNEGIPQVISTLG
ncbi:MAG: FAD-binding oxidoreductase, partial [Bacteroidales bacterium]|nr:FAD-binding oxidoreductase [Bacteroidales bacterium]